LTKNSSRIFSKSVFPIILINNCVRNPSPKEYFSHLVSDASRSHVGLQKWDKALKRIKSHFVILERNSNFCVPCFCKDHFKKEWG
jgi:hypothetical protein